MNIAQLLPNFIAITLFARGFSIGKSMNGIPWRKWNILVSFQRWNVENQKRNWFGIRLKEKHLLTGTFFWFWLNESHFLSLSLYVSNKFDDEIKTPHKDSCIESYWSQIKAFGFKSKLDFGFKKRKNNKTEFWRKSNI